MTHSSACNKQDLLAEAKVAVTDSTLQQVGLNLGVASMRKGERCRLSVTSQYGYGEKGAPPETSTPSSVDLSKVHANVEELPT